MEFIYSFFQRLIIRLEFRYLILESRYLRFKCRM